MSNGRKPRVLAAAAHPDDIEFMMAGTLLLLKEAGCEVHIWNLGDGCCGSASLSRQEAARIRWLEAQESANLAGALLQPSLFADLEIFYDKPSLAQVASVLRDVQPEVILTQSPQDYMEDHQNTVRLIVTAAFSRSMRNFPTSPVKAVYESPVAIYHALPHGLRDSLRQSIEPHLYVNIASTLARKRAMLACHRSQKEWLDVSQGMDAYLNDMEEMSRAIGKMSRRFAVAEGWRRHSHLGFADETFNPLTQLLKDNVYETTP